MTPSSVQPFAYYKDEFVTLYHGAYEDGLASLPLVDCVVTDPPYGDTSLDWDKSPAFGWLARIRPILKPGGTVWTFASLRYLLALAPEIVAGKWQVAQEIVWEKHNGSSFHADRFRRVHELAIQLYRQEDQWGSVYKSPIFVNEATKRTTRRKGRPAHTGDIGPSRYTSEDGGPKLQRSVIYARSCHGRAFHPTQKPEAIVAPLIEYSCPPGGTVLDIFAGSATTLGEARATSKGVRQRTGFRGNTTRARTTPAHDWRAMPDVLANVGERFVGVVIERRPAVQVMTTHDGLETLHYVDPPYPHSTRGDSSRWNYRHEMSDADHTTLASALHGLAGMVVLSGYACELYDRDLFADWIRVEKPTHADGARDRTEVLWLNPACTSALRVSA